MTILVFSSKLQMPFLHFINVIAQEMYMTIYMYMLLCRKCTWQYTCTCYCAGNVHENVHVHVIVLEMNIKCACVHVILWYMTMYMHILFCRKCNVIRRKMYMLLYNKCTWYCTCLKNICWIINLPPEWCCPMNKICEGFWTGDFLFS